MADEETKDKVDQLEGQVEHLAAEVKALRRELAARGVEIPMEENPGKGPMTPEGLKALKQKLAARARAAKPVGKGKGAVSSPRVKKRLERQVKEKK